MATFFNWRIPFCQYSQLCFSWVHWIVRDSLHRSCSARCFSGAGLWPRIDFMSWVSCGGLVGCVATVTWHIPPSTLWCARTPPGLVQTRPPCRLTIATCLAVHKSSRQLPYLAGNYKVWEKSKCFWATFQTFLKSLSIWFSVPYSLDFNSIE